MSTPGNRAKKFTVILLQLSPHRSNIRVRMPYAHIGLGDQARAVAAIPAAGIPQEHNRPSRGIGD